MSLQDVSNIGLAVAFALYTIAFIVYVIALVGSKWSNRDPVAHKRKWGNIGLVIAALGWLSQVTFFVTRWIYSGHTPVSNMFEFMTFLGMMIMLAFLVIYFIYRTPVLGVFALPVGVVILGYASVFPWEAQPLVPSLQSGFLTVHVTLAASGEAFFAVGFAAGLMCLLKLVNFNPQTKKERWERRGVEITIYAILTIVAFVVLVTAFRGAGYEAVFVKEQYSEEAEQMVQVEEKYELPPIFKPHAGESVTTDAFLGNGLFETPSWMQGVNSGKKLNTIVWSLLSGLLLYGLIRLIFRKPIGALIQPLLKDLDADDLDEISYRAIAIGFPIFTLGALIFAMIWAHYAWGRFWGWDPKEVWALITWLFYSAYLHFRLSRGWHGKKSSWLAVLGFVIVMFTLVGVNLIISGLHSYAGV